MRGVAAGMRIAAITMALRAAAAVALTFATGSEAGTSAACGIASLPVESPRQERVSSASSASKPVAGAPWTPGER